MYIIILIVVIAIVIYKFPNIMPENWRIRSGQDTMIYVFRLQPDEKIIHQSSGIYDPNAHLDTKESMVKNIGLGMVGKQLKHWQSVSLAITDQNRFVLSHDPTEEPLSFNKDNLPMIVDTGRKPKKMSPIPPLYRYPGTSGEARIVEISSPEIPDLLIPENTGKFAVSMPVEFISILMDWVKKQPKKDDF